MCRYFNFDKLLSENLEKISESPELHASNMVSGLDSSKDQNEKIGILHSRVFNILFFFARKGEFKVSQKAMISLGLYTKVFKLIIIGTLRTIQCWMFTRTSKSRIKKIIYVVVGDWYARISSVENTSLKKPFMFFVCRGRKIHKAHWRMYAIIILNPHVFLLLSVNDIQFTYIY